MNWLQIRLIGPYFSFFSINSYGYYSQMSQNMFSNGQIFASALIVRLAASGFVDRDNPGTRDSFQWVAVSAKFSNRAYAFELEDKV
jgi:hypothetical protein